MGSPNKGLSFHARSIKFTFVPVILPSKATHLPSKTVSDAECFKVPIHVGFHLESQTGHEMTNHHGCSRCPEKSAQCNVRSTEPFKEAKKMTTNLAQLPTGSNLDTQVPHFFVLDETLEDTAPHPTIAPMTRRLLVRYLEFNQLGCPFNMILLLFMHRSRTLSRKGLSQLSSRLPVKP